MPNSVSARIAAVALLAAAACEKAPGSAPATETPVDPAPGRYDISLSGGGLLNGAGAEPKGAYCLRKGEAAQFGEKIVENYYKLHGSCRLVAEPRVGNRIAGEVRCAADPRLATGMNRFVYAGAVSEDSVKIEVQIKFDAKAVPGGEADSAQVKLAMKAMEQARFVINAVRTGDCR